MGDRGFAARYRLRTKRDFDRVFAQPRRSRSRYFSVLSRPNTVGYARLGLAVSRRVDPRAVGRNRIKRVVRESFRHALPDLPAADVVVIAQHAAANAGNADLRDALAGHWRDLG